MQTCLLAGRNTQQQSGNLGSALGFLWGRPFGFPNPVREAALGLIGAKQDANVKSSGCSWGSRNGMF